MGVKELLDSKGITGKTIVNIAGCPANPDWTVGTIVRLLLGQPLPLDAFNRPTEFYGKNVHENCPRNASAPTHIGYATEFGQDLMCLQDLGCRGPFAMADCPSRKWNNGVNWCVDSNGMCVGCVEPEFPGGPLYQYGSLTTG